MLNELNDVLAMYIYIYYICIPVSDVDPHGFFVFFVRGTFFALAGSTVKDISKITSLFKNTRSCWLRGVRKLMVGPAFHDLEGAVSH